MSEIGRPTRFIMVGRLAPWKGQDVFLRAFAAAFGLGDEEAVVVGAPLFGEESYAESLLHLSEELGIRDRVTFRGFQENVAEEIASADVLVHASIIPEPFGQVVVQGMAGGLAVVASGGGGPAEIVVHGQNGLLVPPGQISTLASTMALLANDPELRATLGAEGRITAENYTPEALLPQLLAVYRSVMNASLQSCPMVISQCP
jgi:glycosyltransferase involved in cell wall biosynthesis